MSQVGWRGDGRSFESESLETGLAQPHPLSYHFLEERFQESGDSMVMCCASSQPPPLHVSLSSPALQGNGLMKENSF